MTVDNLFAEEKSVDLERVIHEFAQLAARLNEGYARKKELAADLVDIAADQRGSNNTVRLTSHDGVTLKIEFKQDTSYDPEQMRVVADLLGDEFDNLFETVIEFKPRRRNLTKFMNTVSTAENVQTAKELIKEATTVREMTPYISLEKGSSK